MSARDVLDQIAQRADAAAEWPWYAEEAASLAVYNPEWRDAHAMFASTLRAAITDHLRSDQ